MNEFTYGWKPLVAATIGTMCGIFTLTNYSQSFFVGPVTGEFGWSASQFFLSYTVMMCLGLVTGPLIGSIAAGMGLRTVGVIGLKEQPANEAESGARKMAKEAVSRHRFSARRRRLTVAIRSFSRHRSQCCWFQSDFFSRLESIRARRLTDGA